MLSESSSEHVKREICELKSLNQDAFPFDRSTSSRP